MIFFREKSARSGGLMPGTEKHRGRVRKKTTEGNPGKEIMTEKPLNEGGSMGD